MSEELREKYARLLREGKTAEATQVARKARGYDDEESQVESDEPGEEPSGDVMSEEERFAELNGVGPELAGELVEEFGSFDNFVENAEVGDLEPVSGIGEKRAESLVSQVR